MTFSDGVNDAIVRVLTVLSRGAFVFLAAIYLDVRDFGLYIAISANISFLQYIVAGDYSYIAHREFFAGRTNFEKLLKTQTVLLGSLFSFSCILIIFLLPKELSQMLVMLIVLILLMESITSELQRHLAAISKFGKINLILIFKSAGWMLPLIVVFYYKVDLRNINAVIVAWLVGLLLSMVVGLYGINYTGVLRERIDKVLLRKYFKTVPIILIGTLATRALFSIDRIVLEKINGLEMAGIYGLFVGVAAAFVAVLDAGILIRAYPNLVSLSSTNLIEYKKLSNLVQRKIAAFTLISIAIYELTIDIFLNLVEKQAYLEYSDIGTLLIFAYGLYSLNFPLHCRLYSLGMDKSITLINVIALTPILTLFVLNGITMTDLALVIINCSMLHYIFRWILIRRICNEN